MSIIEANITIDLDGDVDISAVLSQIEQVISEINDKPTQSNIVDMDNPISTNPLNYRI